MSGFLAAGPAGDTDEAKVVSKATARAAKLMDIPNTTMARVLGLSDASLSRLKTGTFLIGRDSKAFELAVLFLRLFRGLDAITGGDTDAARSWLKTENIALRGQPIALIQTVPGLMQAVQYVDARRARL